MSLGVVSALGTLQFPLDFAADLLKIVIEDLSLLVREEVTDLFEVVHEVGCGFAELTEFGHEGLKLVGVLEFTGVAAFGHELAELCLVGFAPGLHFGAECPGDVEDGCPLLFIEVDVLEERAEEGCSLGAIGSGHAGAAWSGPALIEASTRAVVALASLIEAVLRACVATTVLAELVLRTESATSVLIEAALRSGLTGCKHLVPAGAGSLLVELGGRAEAVTTSLVEPGGRAELAWAGGRRHHLALGSLLHVVLLESAHAGLWLLEASLATGALLDPVAPEVLLLESGGVAAAVGAGQLLLLVHALASGGLSEGGEDGDADDGEGGGCETGPEEF